MTSERRPSAALRPPHREGSLASADGTLLHWQAWFTDAPAPAGAVAVVHGLGEHGGRYRRLADALTPRGWSCWAVDLRGMGRSGGRRGHVDSWDRWIEDAAAFQHMVEQETAPLPVVTLGHSFGGVVVLTAVERKAIRPPRIVLSNPALRTRIVVPAWQRRLAVFAARAWPTLAMGNRVDPALTSRDLSAVEAYHGDPLVHDRISARLFTEWTAAAGAAMDNAARIGVPSLLILGGDDRIIDPDSGRELARHAVPSPTVRVYPGRYHEPFNDLGSEDVFADLAGWLAHAPA